MEYTFERDRDRLRAVKQNSGGRNCNLTALIMVRNDEIRRQAGAESIEVKQFKWFVHLNRMSKIRWPKKMEIHNKKKRCRPKLSRSRGVETAKSQNVRAEDSGLLGCSTHLHM